MRQSLLPLEYTNPIVSGQLHGVVYTKAWVVELLLNLARYTDETNLVDKLAIEPSAGDGAFLVSMVRRLVRSCRKHGRAIIDCASSLIAYEIDEESAILARLAVFNALSELEIEDDVAQKLAEGWVKCGDFLLDGPTLPSADFILGNPPYIRIEEIPEETAGLYRRMYTTMRGRADLYVAFYEAALGLLKEDGICGFICADRWMLNQYGAELRRLVTTSHSVEAIVEMHNANPFVSEVSAYPAITIFKRAAQGRSVVAKLNSSAEKFGVTELTRILDLHTCPSSLDPIAGLSRAIMPSWFQGSDPWPCGSPQRLALLRRLEEEFEPLESEKDHLRIGIGVATGLDRVYITQDPDIVEASRLVPLAMAADTITGHLNWSTHYLINPWDENGLVDLKNYPRLAAYFEKHRAAISGRNTAQRNPSAWYRTIDRVQHPLILKQKLYIPDIKDRFNPVLDRGETYPHHNLYYIESSIWDLEVLGGILLSSVGQFFIESYGVRMRGGYLRFQAQYLRRIRVPRPTEIPNSLSQELINAFRSRDQEAATKAASELYRIDVRELEENLGR